MIDNKILELLSAVIAGRYLDSIRMIEEIKEHVIKLYNSEEN